MQKIIDRLTNGGYTKELAVDDFQKILNAVSSIANSKTKAGLLLLGNVGCGKTTAIKAIVQDYVFVNMPNPSDHGLLLPHVADRRVDGGVYEREGWWTIIDDENVIIDDLGNESIKKSFRNITDVFATFIMQFYPESYKNPNKEARLFITSNLTEEQLEERYGIRTMDRVYEMCTPVTLLQKSHRKYQPRF